jgi:hypothetical protein
MRLKIKVNFGTKAVKETKEAIYHKPFKLKGANLIKIKLFQIRSCQAYSIKMNLNRKTENVEITESRFIKFIKVKRMLIFYVN